MPTSRTRTPRSSSVRPGRVRVGEPAEEHEVGVARHRVEPQLGQPGDDPVALLLDHPDGLEHQVGVRERGERDRLGLGREVVRHPHQAQRVDERGVGGEVAEPPTGQRERLAHRAGHHEPRPAGEQGQRARRARPGELGVRLVDDDQGAVGGVVHRLDHVEGQRRAGRVVRRAEEHDVGPVPPHLLDGGCRVEVERSPARHAAHPVDPGRAGRRGDDRVHRVRRGESERRAAGAAERLQQVQQNLVRAVARPDLLGGHPGAAARQVGREALPQRR